VEESCARNHVVNVARRWLGTPYHTGARVKCQGADCITLLAGIFEEAGLVPRIDIPPYSPQWHLHRDTERYLEGLLRYTHEIEGPPKPGDIALWKFGRCFSHGAIVINWPQVMHAYVGSSCRYENAETAQWLRFIGEGAERGKQRPIRFFSLWV
jgi:cell wall-associated NlpC family hydrolase